MAHIGYFDGIDRAIYRIQNRLLYTEMKKTIYNTRLYEMPRLSRTYQALYLALHKA